MELAIKKAKDVGVAWVTAKSKYNYNLKITKYRNREIFIVVSDVNSSSMTRCFAALNSDYKESC